MAKTGEGLSDGPMALPEVDAEVEAKGSADVNEARRSKGEVASGKGSCFENSSAP
jgi:hypothetical protein